MVEERGDWYFIKPLDGSKPFRKKMDSAGTFVSII